VVTAVDTRVLDATFVDRPYDQAFLAELPPEIDPCGERGKFHTFVWDGPIFQQPVRCKRTRIARFQQMVFCDLVPIE